RLVAVGRGEERGALYVRVVVGAACGEVHERDVELLQEREEFCWLGEIELRWIFGVDAEAPVVGACAGAGVGFENSWPGLAGSGERGIGMIRRDVEGGKADADFEHRIVATDASDDFAEEPGAVFE